MTNCKVIIDGSNFYFKLKKIGLQKLVYLDLKGFSNSLLLPNEKLDNATYYVGQVKPNKTLKSIQMYSQQRQLLSNLKKNKVEIFLGYLLKSGGKYNEKGVDVKMAIDIVVEAFERKSNKIILISSDTDLLPAIKIAQSKGQLIHYISFKNDPSFALKATASSYKLLIEKDIITFMKGNLK